MIILLPINVACSDGRERADIMSILSTWLTLRLLAVLLLPTLACQV
jgi:hypothetical protein